jgi:hypothetical protein
LPPGSDEETIMPKTTHKTFSCPRCGELLSVLDGAMVKMSGTLETPTFSVTTAFYFPAELGRYGAIVGDGVEVREGAKVELCCVNPRCAASFTASYNHDLAEIRMTDEDGRAHVVVFHKTCGRHATFVIDLSARQLVSTFGEHAATYAGAFDRPPNFFGE